MTYGSDVRSTTTRLDCMRPAQITVGRREVQARRKNFDQAQSKAIAFTREQDTRYLPGWPGEARD